MIGKLLRTFWQDIRFGARLLSRSPGFTLAAVLTLALGLGANFTIFNWMDHLVYGQVPGAEDPQRIVFADCHSPNFGRMAFSYPNYLDYRDRTRTLSGLFACSFLHVNLTEGGQPERVWGEIVTGNYFDVLGVRPVLGRGFLPEEDRTAGTHAVTVLSHGLWQRRFGGDPRVLGRTIRINNHPFTIVGVAPASFHGSWAGLDFALWVPMMMQPVMMENKNHLKERGEAWLNAMGRLAPGVSLEQARQEFQAISRGLAREYPDINATVTATLVELKDAPDGAPSYMGPVLKVLLMLTGLVLLAACTNVANLILVRASARQKELAVRLSLGATRGRILRQLLSEQMLLFLMGGTLSLLLLLWSDRLILSIAGSMDFPLGMNFGVDLRMVGVAILVTLGVGAIFGLLPALQATKMNLSAVLKEEGSSVTGNRRRARIRGGLVVAQLALALVLLVSAGLFVHSLLAAGSVDLGLHPEGVVLSSLDLFSSGYDQERAVQFQNRLLEKVRSLPGVQSAALVRTVPLGLGGNSNSGMSVEGYQPRRDEVPSAMTNWVSSDFLKLLGISLVQGREFTDRDDARAPRVIMVNEALVRTYLPGVNPVGRTIHVERNEWRIVGVTRDYRYHNLEGAVEPMILFPYAQFPKGDVTLMARSGGDPVRTAAGIREVVGGLDSGMPVFGVKTMEEHMKAITIPQRMAAMLLCCLGSLVLLITVVGLYGVLSQAASQRTREIGIRMAFGASPSRIVCTIVRQGLVLLGVGTILGVAGAWACARLFASLLVGVSASDPLVFVVVPLLLGGIALVACLLPAWRASGLWPSTALRHE